MPMDGLMIGAVCAELTDALAGARVDKINQPEKDELVFFCRGKDGNKKLFISANASFARLCLTNASKPNPLTPPTFCMLLRKHLSGAKIIAFKQPSNERIVFITFEVLNDFNEPERKQLIVEIMGKYSNIILTDANGRILDAIQRVNSLMSRMRLIQPGLTYAFPPSQGKLDPFGESIPKISPMPRLIADTFTGISRQSAEEIAYRCGSQPFVRAFAEFLEPYVIRRYEPVILLDENGAPVDFYAVRQQRFLPEFFKPCDSISEAMEMYYAMRDQMQHIRERAKELRLLIVNLLEKSERKQARQQEKLTECADMEKYRIYGELLTANIYKVARGAKSITVQNYYDNTSLEIPLDNTVSPSANVQKYFKQYNKLKTASKLIEEQISETLGDIEFLTEQAENIEKCESDADISDIRRELVEAGYIKPQAQKQKPSESKPMHFVSSSGIDIYVGKNNTQNDKLTLHFAHSDDLWLHTKDIHGSHVIVCSDSPDDRTVEEAAMLAAYYSKARLSSSVPVDATKRKFVKKPSGALPGKVIYTNQTTYYITVNESAIRAIKKV